MKAVKPEFCKQALLDYTSILIMMVVVNLMMMCVSWQSFINVPDAKILLSQAIQLGALAASRLAIV